MTKPISTRVHGIIDYTWAAVASTAAGRMNGSTSTARLLRGAANAATASAIVTNYECGAVRILPMRGHLAFDAALCTALIASPLFLPAAERRHAATPVLLGVMGLIVGMLTQTRSPMEEEFGGVYRGGERSIVDLEPDVPSPAYLRPHLE
jgi:hypothetical protein